MIQKFDYEAWLAEGDLTDLRKAKGRPLTAAEMRQRKEAAQGRGGGGETATDDWLDRRIKERREQRGDKPPTAEQVKAWQERTAARRKAEAARWKPGEEERAQAEMDRIDEEEEASAIEAEMRARRRKRR